METPPSERRPAVHRDAVDRVADQSDAEEATGAPEPGLAARRFVDPPVLPFRYFKLAIKRLKEGGGLPHRIDRSAWTSKQFWTVGSDIVPAFHFLHLIDDQGRPSPSLSDLVATMGTETWHERLSTVLIAAYPDIIAIGIARVTPKEVLVQLRKRYAIDAARGRMATAFLVHALSDAQLDEGSFMPRRSRAQPQAVADATVPRTSALLEKLPPFDDAWSDELKLAWLTAFNELAAIRK